MAKQVRKKKRPGERRKVPARSGKTDRIVRPTLGETARIVLAKSGAKAREVFARSRATTQKWLAKTRETIRDIRSRSHPPRHPRRRHAPYVPIGPDQASGDQQGVSSLTGDLVSGPPTKADPRRHAKLVRQVETFEAASQRSEAAAWRWLALVALAVVLLLGWSLLT